MAQAAQRSYGCSIPGSVEDRAGWRPLQSDLVDGVIDMAGVGTR